MVSGNVKKLDVAGLFKVFTLPSRGAERNERKETSAADEGASLLHSTCSGAQLPIPTAVSLYHTSLVDYVVNVSEGRVLNPPAYLSSLPDAGPRCRGRA